MEKANSCMDVLDLLLAYAIVIIIPCYLQVEFSV